MQKENSVTLHSDDSLAIERSRVLHFTISLRCLSSDTESLSLNYGYVTCQPKLIVAQIVFGRYFRWKIPALSNRGRIACIEYANTERRDVYSEFLVPS